jgi:hypothetical protein
MIITAVSFIALFLNLENWQHFICNNFKVILKEYRFHICLRKMANMGSEINYLIDKLFLLGVEWNPVHYY